MKITVMTRDDRFFSLDVEAEELVENVKALLEVETGVSMPLQRLLYNSRDLPNSSTLRSAGVIEGDLLILHTVAPSPAPAPTPPGNNLSLATDGSAVDPRALQQHLRSNPEMINQLLQTNPELAQAILGDDLDALQNFLRQQHLHKLELQRQQQEELALLNADPFDVDAQRKIEAAIQQKNIYENWEAAIEHNPEAFARVIMLYVDMEVNGVPIKAFVDSGAQMTIISKSCAERCGLLRLLDKRYVGIAKGVGQSEIVGRIHVAHIKIGGKFFMCSFTVLEQSDVEFMFGLDMLRKHQCSIDLKDNVLRVGGGEVAVPFLHEKDLPEHVKEHYEAMSSEGASTSAMAPQGAHLPKKASVPISERQLPVQAAPPSGVSSEMETKIGKLMQLGFDRNASLQALQLFNGNEEQAASYLFGGF
ncbi:hypothetical protein GOP47_0017280 [Adiantum capillus-veneris]|uniref:DNA damage-inducible protein 1 n=1 Tax=Adiantum capillus-veneris TaxID=13818 RepID=A0A9D4UFH5_ADICA|nr:hypothetical protein GOP47_0017280 [Adiantum capillus-veneris]